MDQSFIAMIKLEGYGNPEQVEKEFRLVLGNILHEQFGDRAKLTSLTRTAYERSPVTESPLLSDDPMVYPGSSNDPMVEE